MELTQEYFDQALKNLATKDDLKELSTKQDVRNAVEELARLIADTVATPMERHFADLKDYLEVRKDVHTLKVEMQKIKEVLHIA